MSPPDVLVAGGGIVGLSTAWHLVKGGARVLLLDAGEAGRATDAGAGILATADAIDHPDPVQRFVARAARHYPALIEELAAEDAGPTGYKVAGRLSVAVDPGEAAELRAIEAHLARHPDDDLRLLDAAEAKALFPPLGRVIGALYSRRGARVDGRLLGAALRRAATGRGLAFERRRVERLLLERGRVGGVEVTGETRRAGTVVLAAGAWSRALGRTIGIEIPVRPMRGQIAHLDLDQESAGWPIVTGFREHYMVPWDDRRIAVGATREAGAGFAVRTTAAGVMEVLSEALRVAPGLASAGLREIRVGLRPASADGLPILGPVEAVPGLMIATGHGPLGLQLGPFSGKAIAELILDGRAPGDLGPFRLQRFG